jgi:acetolactate synthase I/II/III large subunit
MIRAHRGADAVMTTLSKAGVKHIFALSGNHIMPLFDACLDADIRLFHTRHEAAAVHMADAWARLTGEIGIAMVTGGPGHANAVSALYTAQMAEAPLVLLSGHAPQHQLGMGAFQEMRQAEVAAPVTKAAWTVARAEDIAADLARAIRIARSGRPGPVQLNLPTDVIEAACSECPEASASAFAPERQPLDPGTARAAIEWLGHAKRPLILAGPACMTRDGRARSAGLRAACGVPVIGMESPRGIADPSLGAFGEMLAQADRVMLLGKRLDFTLKFGSAPAFGPTCEFMQIDADLGEIERTRRAVGGRLAAARLADAFGALDALAAAGRRAGTALGDWARDVDAAIAYRPSQWLAAASSSSDRVHPAAACAPLQALLDSDPDAVFVSDGGEFGQWAQACLNAPERIVNGVAGAIGAALPFAVAARIARPNAPIVATMGDGTFGFHTSEIDTAVRYGLPFVAVVGNDARWNAEHQIQLRDYGTDRLTGCELLPTRYDRVTEAFGGFGRLVTRAEDVLPAALDAHRARRPACVNIMIDGLPAPDVRRDTEALQ